MNFSEIAMQIVLKALDKGEIALRGNGFEEEEESLSERNKINAKQISDFYSEIYKTIVACEQERKFGQ